MNEPADPSYPIPYSLLKRLLDPRSDAIRKAARNELRALLAILRNHK